MNKILTLIKYDFIAVLNKICKKKKNTSLIVLVIIFGFSMVAFSFISTTILDIEQLLGSGLEHVALHTPLMIWISSTGIFIISKSTLTKEKNTDFLLSIPLKKTTIVSSKTISSLIFNLIVGTALFIPSCFVYFYMLEQSILIIINSFLLLILLSIFFTGIGYLFNSFINFFIIRFRIYKLIRAILVLTSILGFIYCNSLLQFDFNTLEVVIISDLIDIVTSNNILNLLILFVFSLISISIGTLIFSKVYGKQPVSFKSTKSKLSFNTSSQFKTLYKKEMKSYFNSTMYLFNTIVGYILLLGGSIFFAFSEMIDTQEIIYISLCGCLALTCTTNSSISLEGKNIWLIKTAPIKIKTIFMSKLATNISLLLICITTSFFIILFSGKVQIDTLILLYILALVIGIFVACTGLLINLILPKLDFKTEMEVVKQSASSIVSILSFIVFLTIPGLLIMLGVIPLELNQLLLINIGYIVIINILVNFILFTKGIKLFKIL